MGETQPEMAGQSSPLDIFGRLGRLKPGSPHLSDLRLSKFSPLVWRLRPEPLFSTVESERAMS